MGLRWRLVCGACGIGLLYWIWLLVLTPEPMEYSVLYACEGGAHPYQVTLDVGAQYNLPTTPQGEQRLVDLWDTYRAERPGVAVYDALKFRLASVGPSTSPPAPFPIRRRKGATRPASCEAIRLQIGITSWRETVGTSFQPLTGLTSGDGIGLPSGMSNAIGVEGVVETLDHKVLLIRRHGTEKADFYSTPGGHPEPVHALQKVGARLPEKNPEESPKSYHDAVADMLRDQAGAVVGEVFGSVLDEVTMEIGVPRGTLSDPVLLGLIVSHEFNNKPDMCFVTSCSMTAQQVQKVYSEKKGKEAGESSELLMLRLEELVPFLKKTSVTPPSRAALDLYLVYRTKRVV